MTGTNSSKTVFLRRTHGYASLVVVKRLQLKLSSARAHTRFPRVYGVIDQISANNKRGEALIGKQVTTALYNKLPLPNVLEVLEQKDLAGHVFISIPHGLNISRSNITLAP